MDTDSRAQRTRDAYNNTLDIDAVPWSELAGYRREAWRVAADVASSGLYELVNACRLEVGDHIYLNGSRRIVTAPAYQIHSSLFRIPVSDDLDAALPVAAHELIPRLVTL